MIFETRVQAAFAVLMLTGRVAPCLLKRHNVGSQSINYSHIMIETKDLIRFSKNDKILPGRAVTKKPSILLYK